MNLINRTICLLAFVAGIIFPFHTYAQVLDIEGASLGGKVRNGPSMESKQLGSLKEGSLIVLQENTGVMMNGYPWFKFIHIDNQTGYSIEGYQWGGIVCAFDKGVAGVFNRCPRFWSDNEEWLRKTKNEESGTLEQEIAPRHSNGEDDDKTAVSDMFVATQENADAVIENCITEEDASQRDGSACIDRFAEACNEKNESYAKGDPTCSGLEFKVWDRILNAQYKKLMASIGDKAKQTSVRNAQRAWNSFADSFCPLSYEITGGSFYRVISANCKIRVTARQAFELYRLVALQVEPRSCAITRCP